MVICTGVSAPVETTSATPEGFLEEILAQASVRDAVDAFLSRRRRTQGKSKTIQVLQGECAQICLEEEESDVVLESTAATTCVIGVALCRSKGRASVAHFDEPSVAAFTQWLGDMTRPSIYLVGDFELPERWGESISGALLWFLHKSRGIWATIELACVRSFNTRTDGWPISYALSYDCATETAFPALMDEAPVPALMERSSRAGSISAGRVLEDVYDEGRQMLHIRRVRVRVPRNLELLLGLTDKDVLQCFSTSPLHEPDSFVPDIRARWNWMATLGWNVLDQPEQWFEWNSDVGWQKAFVAAEQKK